MQRRRTRRRVTRRSSKAHLFTFTRRLRSSTYCHNVTAIEPKWLVEVAPQFFKVADANKISKRKKQEKIEPLFNKYEKADEWRLSKVKRSARSSQTFG
ncbi:hypothetical protein NUW54_g607 [Trametes sanguinea]|uniref:Uncharacterized protein n=1 Tax=Trametes sanguinea TaxID=158606 RepID=A0ACC1QB57_9APHY|nr:hypothetical protein NUW54_g607 [Trametes sanguinea]